MRHLTANETGVIAGGAIRDDAKNTSGISCTIEYITNNGEQIFYYALAAAFAICSIAILYDMHQTSEYMKEIMRIKENCPPYNLC